MQDTIGALSVETAGASDDSDKVEDPENFHVKAAGAESADDQEHVAGDLQAEAAAEAVSGTADGAEETEKREETEGSDE